MQTEMSIETVVRTYELVLEKTSHGTWASFVTCILVTSMFSDFLNKQKGSEFESKIFKNALSVLFEKNFKQNFELLAADDGWMTFLDYADSVLRPPPMFERFLSYLIN